MTAFDLATLIGEFVATEIDDVNKVEYAKHENMQTAFSVVMENGSKFCVNVEKV